MLPLFASYLSLEPSYTQALGQSAPTFDTSKAAELGTSLSFLFTLGVMVCVLAGGVMYMRAGAIRLKASEQAIRKSNEEIKRITLGLVGVLSLFVIIYTLNKDLLNVNVGLEKLRVNKATTSVTPTTQTTTQPTSGSSSYQARLESHNAAVARLSPSGIKTNHDNQPCTEAQFNESTPRCTSLSYLPEETIQMLLRVNGSCNCGLIISGGTEPGHSTHGEYKRPVDLKLSKNADGSSNQNDPLYVFIKGVGNSIGPSNSCFQRYTWSSFTFCDEKPRSNSTWDNHFHVS